MKTQKLSAGVIVVRRFGGEYKYLLLRSYRNWDFPKGEMESGEEPLQTAERETEEESGLTSLLFRWGRSYRETEPYGQGKVARYYLALSDHGEPILPVNPLLGRPEHHEWRWMNFIEAEAFLPERLKPLLAWARRKIEENLFEELETEDPSS